MAISRVTDLPEIHNDWGYPSTDQTDFLAKSKLEISYPIQGLEGRYESKSVRCDTLKDYIVSNIEQTTEFNKTAFFYDGAELTGHVGINEYINDDDVHSDYGLYAKGEENELYATATNQINAKNKNILQSNELDLFADQAVNLQSDGTMNIQAAADTYLNSTTLYIASDISTIIANGSIDNTMFAVGNAIAESYVPLHAPTPFIDSDSNSTQVVNIDYLNGAYKTELSAAIKDAILDILNQQKEEEGGGGGGGDEPVPDVPQNYMSVYDTANRLFEIRTFDYRLDTDPQQNKKRKLWLLGSTITNANVNIPNAFSILSSASSSPGQDDYVINGTQYNIPYVEDEYGHKITRNIPQETIKTIVDYYGAFWYYNISASTSLSLPINYMFFRSGGTPVKKEVGTFIKAHFPEFSSKTVAQVYKSKPSGVSKKLHTVTGPEYIKFGSDTKLNIELNDIDSEKYENDNYDVVSPPSVQTFTYLVLF